MSDPLLIVSIAIALIVILLGWIPNNYIPSILNSETDSRLLIQTIGTFLVLLAALYIILSGKYDVDTTKWAFGTVGFLIGHWIGAGNPAADRQRRRREIQRELGEAPGSAAKTEK